MRSSTVTFSAISQPQRLPSLRVRMAEPLADHLIGEIDRGRWADELPSERALSLQLRVSRPTLRKALRALASRGIIVARPRFPYLIRRRTGMLAAKARLREVVLIYTSDAQPDLSGIAPLISELRRALHALGFDLRLVNLAQHGTRRVLRTLGGVEEDFRPSYYLLLSVPSSIHRWFEARNLPCIISGARLPDVRLPSVDVDQEAMLAHAVGYLARRGHRRIVLFQPSGDSVGFRRGAQTFQRSCRDHQASGVIRSVRIANGDASRLERAIERVLSADRPSAFIVSDVGLVLSLYTCLFRAGLSIPRDVSVMLTVHVPTVDFLRPMPTCYQFSWENFSTRIIRLIETHLRLGQWPERCDKVLPRLREGGSVAHPRPRPPGISSHTTA